MDTLHEDLWIFMIIFPWNIIFVYLTKAIEKIRVLNKNCVCGFTWSWISWLAEQLVAYKEGLIQMFNSDLKKPLQLMAVPICDKECCNSFDAAVLPVALYQWFCSQPPSQSAHHQDTPTPYLEFGESSKVFPILQRPTTFQADWRRVQIIYENTFLVSVSFFHSLSLPLVPHSFSFLLCWSFLFVSVKDSFTQFGLRSRRKNKWTINRNQIAELAL